MGSFSITESWQRHLPLTLSPLWQVLYYEGIHGHHILFSTSDLAAFATLPTKLACPLDCLPEPTLSEVGYRLLHAPSFRDMVSTIDSLSFERRYHVYLLYQDWLKSMARRLKKLAN